MARTWWTVAVLLVLSISSPYLPAWSQSPGLTDPVVPPSGGGTPGPGSSAPGQALSWNLSELLWGVAQLQESPRPLSEEQKKRVRPALIRILDGARLVKDFEVRAKAVLSTDQVAYIEHLAVTGALTRDPPDLPPAPPGQDPLVNRVLQILEEKAGQ